MEKVQKDLEGMTVQICDKGNMREVYRKRCVAAVMGLVVGDALGVPAEFMSRAELKENPITDMVGYGTHEQPAGTWSDDSSMTIATIEWLSESKEFPLDYNALMDKFSEWLMYGEYTPYGENFDNGISTSRALIRYSKGIEPIQCGGKAENENGNGSLMRILPVALVFSDGLLHKEFDKAEYIFNMSSLTHAHMRSKLGCLIYSKLVADLLWMPESDKVTMVRKSLQLCREYLDSKTDEDIVEEKESYGRLWNVEAFMTLPEEQIKSSGYVVDTLEAAIWCFLNTDSYKDCVLCAVNLGDDTDTVGAVAGGLAGLYYGLNDIPQSWLALIPKRDWIIELTERMIVNFENR